MPVDTRIRITAVVRFPIIDQAQGFTQQTNFLSGFALETPDGARHVTRMRQSRLTRAPRAELNARW